MFGFKITRVNDEGEEEEIKVDSFEEAKKEVQRREDKELAERIVKGIFD